MDPNALPPTDGLMAAIQQQHWPIVAGFLITFLVYGANHAGLQAKVGAKWIPRIAIGLGVLSAIAAQLLLGISWQEALSKGFLAGATATGLWEVLLKDLLPKIPDKTVAAVVEAVEAVVSKATLKTAKPADSEAAATTVKAKKKPGPKPGTKKVKAEAVVAPAAPAEVPAAPVVAEEPKAPEAAAEVPASPPVEPKP
jgi:hypothetical protein